jgi:hypothetical protein
MKIYLVKTALGICAMKTLVILATLACIVPASFADERIIGAWKDKSEPEHYEFEFKDGNDFVFTQTWGHVGELESRVLKGAWEIGSWKITNSTGLTESCNLTVYAGTQECCFEYKFIADNLILESRYTSNKKTYAIMCDNRVLVKSK